MTFGCNNYNDFPDNQTTKFRVVWCVIILFIGWSWTFTPPPLNFCKASRFVPYAIGWTPLHLILKSSQPLTSTLSFLHFPITTIICLPCPLFPLFLLFPTPPLFTATMLWRWRCILQRKQRVSAWNRHAFEPVFSFEPQTFSCTGVLSFY